MSFDDDWLKPLFPVRFCVPGKNIEREMLAAVGGADTIRTRIQMRADGSTVMLRTRGGFPEFTVTNPVVKSNYTLFTETDYEARTYVTENMYIGGPYRGFSFPFDYVKTIQLFDEDGGECVLTFPDPFSTECYAPTLLTCANRFMKFPLSAPKAAQLTGTATATITFEEPPAEIDVLDTTSVSYFGASAFRSAATYARAVVVEHGISSLIVGDLKFVFADPVNNL